ncbi:MAG TPA: N-6 DNA methylase [bacterium]|nr:N-6 DNA methylase [bacterium]
MTAPSKVKELVERFDRNKDVYCGSGFNETQLRREFVDPLFEALGWDVDNKRGVSPLYQDVVHEYGTEVEGSQKTADYAFRVGEKVKFFVEAKKPGTRLKDDAGPALQLRRYAYSAGLPLSILTDFEEFAAYDGRVPPKKADAASRARVMYFTYDQYVDAWEEIAAVFSRDAVWSGAFDTYADENRGGKAEPVDKAFLKLLEHWRDELARNVANRNREKDLDKYELSAAVQAILDRVIFLRVAEDRGIEGRGRLEALRTGEGVYAGLMALCLEADDVYNSGLFHFRDEKGRATSRDELTPTLHVDDAILRKIIRELSESPYEFGVVPVEILGQVYEQFLGKTIWLDGRGVHIDYKPEVRKAKGVYYTPQYIVEYIVKNTVGELLKGCKSPKDAAKLKILDPACGSGSFLLGAYQHLINWHLEWYVGDDPGGYEGKVVPTPGPGPVSWRLTAAAKKDILVNNLFGVDIDPQAVEVTKLSLLLKALEGESRESVGAQTKFLRERILPDLAGNVKCGNSLIGSDYWDFARGKTVGLSPLSERSFEITEEERRRVNPFDWEVEFADIMKAGGFDAVIGNPPWVYQLLIGEEKDYLVNKYKTFVPTADLYVCFTEEGLKLTRGNGFFGLIVPNKWLRVDYGANLRSFIKEFEIVEMVDFRDLHVFEGATNYPLIILVLKSRPKRKPSYVPVRNLSFRYLSEEVAAIGYKLEPGALDNEGFSLVRPKTQGVLDKINNVGTPLREYAGAKIYRGVLTGFNNAFIINRGTRDRLIAKDPKSAEIIEPFVFGDDVRRYYINFRERFLIFTRRGIRIERYPGVKEYLANWRDELTPKKTSKEKLGRKPGNYKWYEIQDTIDYFAEFDKPKIIYGQFQIAPHFALDRTGLTFGSNHYMLLGLSADVLLFLLGVLNSKVYFFFMNTIVSSIQGATLVAQKSRIVNFPIPILNTSGTLKSARHDNMVALVEEMLELHKRLARAKSDPDKQRLQRAVATTDRKIDNLVYELYGLADEEIRIVES